jgi:hypothetical protein
MRNEKCACVTQSVNQSAMSSSTAVLQYHNSNNNNNQNERIIKYITNILVLHRLINYSNRNTSITYWQFIHVKLTTISIEELDYILQHIAITSEYEGIYYYC